MEAQEYKVDNLDKIISILKFYSEDVFYFIQIIKRRKENPSLLSNSKVIKTYYIESVEHLKNKYAEMKLLSEFHNARVYINLNSRSYEKSSIQTARLILDQMCNKDYHSAKDAFNSVCGKYNGNSDKIWIIDVDNKDTTTILNIKKYISNIGGNVLELIPTVQGFHILSSPFRLDLFKESFPEIEVHKNNPTLLYYKLK